MIRIQYRACIKTGTDKEQWEDLLAKTKEHINKSGYKKELVELALYRHENLLFLYMESLSEIKPDEILAPLSACLCIWPEASGETYWALMYHIYHHSIPNDPKGWVKEREGNTKRVGRIAFLHPQKLFSYTYWHYAIVEEGLLKGDKYQYISLHENILFSYFEEPRHNVNIRQSDEPSKVIDKWLAVDPESHFIKEKTGGENFLIIDEVLMIDAGIAQC